jgi:hypothetical protein
MDNDISDNREDNKSLLWMMMHHSLMLLAPPLLFYKITLGHFLPLSIHSPAPKFQPIILYSTTKVYGSSNILISIFGWGHVVA